MIYQISTGEQSYTITSISADSYEKAASNIEPILETASYAGIYRYEKAHESDKFKMIVGFAVLIGMIASAIAKKKSGKNKSSNETI